MTASSALSGRTLRARTIVPAPLPTGYRARGFRVVAAVTIFLATTSGPEAVRGLSADSSRLATDLAWLA